MENGREKNKKLEVTLVVVKKIFQFHTQELWQCLTIIILFIMKLNVLLQNAHIKCE